MHALHVSAANGHVRCCEVLLDLGADVDIPNQRQRTPLMYAKNIDVLRLLLSRGAKVHARDAGERTALHYCTLYGRSSEAVRELVSAGGDKNAVDSHGCTPLMATPRAKYAFDAYDRSQAALELINLGADVNAKDIKGKAALHHHSRAYGGKCTDVIVSALVAAGADLEAINKKHRTPLFEARSSALPGCPRSQRFSILNELVELGVNVHAVDNGGRTALMVAAQSGDASLVHELIQVGAHLDAEDEVGNTAIMQYVSRHRWSLGCSQRTGQGRRKIGRV